MTTTQATLTPAAVRALLPSWVRTMRSERKSPQTMKGYEQAVDMYLAYCERTRRAPMKRDTMRHWMAQLLDDGRQPATVRARLAGVQNLANWMLDEDDVELDANPFAGLKRPKLDDSLVTPLTGPQVQAMLADCKAPRGATYDEKLRARRDEAIIRLMAETGLRSSELVGLQLDDVDLDQRLAVVLGKGGKMRAVRFSLDAATALDRYLRLRAQHARGRTTRLWLGANGMALSYSGLDYTLKAHAAAAGLEGFHNHMLRHTAAHRWLAAGGTETSLMAMAGWSRSDMLQRYTRKLAGERAAAEADRLGLGDFSA